jgi:hypothetical protein
LADAIIDQVVSLLEKYGLTEFLEVEAKLSHPVYTHIGYGAGQNSLTFMVVREDLKGINLAPLPFLYASQLFTQSTLLTSASIKTIEAILDERWAFMIDNTPVSGDEEWFSKLFILLCFYDNINPVNKIIWSYDDSGIFEYLGRVLNPNFTVDNMAKLASIAVPTENLDTARDTPSDWLEQIYGLVPTRVSD